MRNRRFDLREFRNGFRLSDHNLHDAIGVDPPAVLFGGHSAGKSEIARRLNIGRTSVRRILSSKTS
jgi:hypothetical protein